MADLQTTMYRDALAGAAFLVHPLAPAAAWQAEFDTVYTSTTHQELSRPDALGFRALTFCRAVLSLMGTSLPVNDAVVEALHNLTQGLGLPMALYRSIRDNNSVPLLLPCWRSLIRLMPEAVKIHYTLVQVAIRAEQWDDAAGIVDAMFEHGWNSHPEEAEAIVKWATAAYRPGHVHFYVQLEMLARMHCSPNDVQWPLFSAKMDEEMAAFRYQLKLDVEQACLDLPDLALMQA